VSDTAIEIQSVTKTFKIHEEKAQSAKERLIRLGRNPYHTFRALDGVSFDVLKGETFGVLGHNGSGKSTLLKCIAGTLRPDSGRISYTGRLAALLELGAGFHADLTGRENVYMNGSILGFSKEQVDDIFDDIVEFSELGEFIDNQVKHYSSGMYARLGFSVAINVEPEILLIDEVLSVGDEAFQRKCLERVKQLRSRGSTIVVVTHNAEILRQIADRVAVLDHGHLVAVAPPGEGIRAFRETLIDQGEAPPPELYNDIDQDPTYADAPSGSVPIVDVGKPVAITAVKVEYPDPDARYLLPSQPIRLRVDYAAPRVCEDVLFTVEVHDEQGNLMFAIDNEILGAPVASVDGVGALCFDIPCVPLLDGRFPISVALTSTDGGTVYDRHDQQESFEVMNPGRVDGLVSIGCEVVHLVRKPATSR
jgi:ABC-type polysaccharide/polyol phosphate transport system ATPase subunit